MHGAVSAGAEDRECKTAVSEVIASQKIKVEQTSIRSFYPILEEKQ
jgi:hypothetical protein